MKNSNSHSVKGCDTSNLSRMKLKLNRKGKPKFKTTSMNEPNRQDRNDEHLYPNPKE